MSLTLAEKPGTNYPAVEPQDRIARARAQNAALKKLDRQEKVVSRKIEAGYKLLSEAAQIRRKALADARDTGIPVSELANRLNISLARAYQLLSDGTEDEAEKDGHAPIS
jgi:DNA invertase Pin-like site-specific DNA recombinase